MPHVADIDATVQHEPVGGPFRDMDELDVYLKAVDRALVKGRKYPSQYGERALRRYRKQRKEGDYGGNKI